MDNELCFVDENWLICGWLTGMEPETEAKYRERYKTMTYADFKRHWKNKEGNKMKKFTITVIETSTVCYTVEANTAEEAREMFENRFFNDETFNSAVNKDLEKGYQGCDIYANEEDVPDDAVPDFTYDEMKKGGECK